MWEKRDQNVGEERSECGRREIRMWEKRDQNVGEERSEWVWSRDRKEWAWAGAWSVWDHGFPVAGFSLNIRRSLTAAIVRVLK